MKFLSTLFFALFILTLSASNYHGEIHQFKQPDGTVVDVKLYGSEFYIRAEGLDGFTLIRDKATNWIKDIFNVSYALPNYLTSRRINLKLKMDF